MALSAVLGWMFQVEFPLQRFTATVARPGISASAMRHMASSPLRSSDGTPREAAYREFMVNSEASSPLIFAHRICWYSLVWARGLPSLPAGAW